MQKPTTNSPVIAITLGDPAGIGPEIVAMALLTTDAAARQRIVVMGDTSVLHRAFDAIGQPLPKDIRVRDVGAVSANAVVPGQPNSFTAKAQIAYLEAAVAAAKAGEIDAMVTAPISKAQAKSAGFAFPGHTEFLAARFEQKNVAMLFASPKLRVVLATVHVAIADVPKVLSVERIETVIALSVLALRRDFAIAKPRIGILGLNPHAGEEGMFGDEEERIIGPAIERCRRAFPDVTFAGPLSPDTAYRQAFDLFVAMYHDQALIPVKLSAFETAVNVTLGLPIVRTSPDHGVAYDIAGTGTADGRPFQSALELAMVLVGNRRLTS